MLAQPTCVLVATQVYNQDFSDAETTEWILVMNNDGNLQVIKILYWKT